MVELNLEGSVHAACAARLFLYCCVSLHFKKAQPKIFHSPKVENIVENHFTVYLKKEKLGLTISYNLKYILSKVVLNLRINRPIALLSKICS